MFIHKLLLEYFADLYREAGSGGLSAESQQQSSAPETMLLAVEMSTDTEEGTEMSTVPLALSPVLSDDPRILPCGHERYASNARFCTVCGKRILP
jgi:hypothetical protein